VVLRLILSDDLPLSSCVKRASKELVIEALAMGMPLAYKSHRSLDGLQFICDGLVKSGSVAVSVIPVQAGVQSFQVFLDTRLRESDGSGAFYDVVI
jgi:hypothetical protein